MNDFETFLITLAVTTIPITAIVISLANAFYEWLMSKLPKNVQTVLIAHDAQIRNYITSVVNAVEQQMKGEYGDAKKAEAIDKAKAIFASLSLPKSIPQPSDELIDTLIEEAVSYLPHAAAVPPPEPPKPASTTNVFTDQTPTVKIPTWNGTVPLSATGTTVTYPLDPPPILSDAL